MGLNNTQMNVQCSSENDVIFKTPDEGTVQCIEVSNESLLCRILDPLQKLLKFVQRDLHFFQNCDNFKNTSAKNKQSQLM